MDARDILEWFTSGRLVRPEADQPNFVDLVRAVAGLAGATGWANSRGIAALSRQIGPADHIVLILVDGMGWRQLQALPACSFLRRNTVMQLQSVFMSTTASALTTLATGQWPAIHAIPGWWTYLPERDVCAVTLPFIDRVTQLPLSDLGISVAELLPAPSIWPGLTRRVLSIVPTPLTGTTYSRYACGETASAGYGDLDAAFAIAAEALQLAARPSLIYLYLPQYDGICHKQGVDHQQTRELLTKLDVMLDRFATSLAGKARVVITADHGLLDTAPDHRFILTGRDPLRRHLQCDPSGERTVPIFHVHPGREDDFLGEFEARFGDHFALLTPAEVEHLRLMGPDALSPQMKERLGTFVGIAPYSVQLYASHSRHPETPLIGVHGGLSPAEMHIPLILA
jgi:hypothetical protein